MGTHVHAQDTLARDTHTHTHTGYTGSWKTQDYGKTQDYAERQDYGKTHDYATNDT